LKPFVLNKIFAPLAFTLALLNIVGSQPLHAQCLDALTGSYGTRFCSDPDTAGTPYFISTIALYNDTSLVFRNFHNIPNGMIGCEDSIVAVYRCSDDSLFFQMVNYPTPGLQYIGKGHRLVDTIQVRYIQMNPSGFQEICLRYVKGLGLRLSELKSNPKFLFPNPISQGMPLNGWPENTARIVVLNVQGQCVWEWNTAGGLAIWPGNIPAGMYLIRTFENNGVAAKSYRMMAW
jgi:hypothetical protein